MKKLWFRRRSYGWGWFPVTIEGWLVTIVAILVIIASGSILKENTILGITPIILVIIILIIICIKKGEKPKWQWGRK